MERIDAILKHPFFIDTLKRLEKKERKRIYCTHDIEHLLAVARIMQLQAIQMQAELPRDVLYATALLHDIGRLHQYKTGEKHALVGAELAKPILQDCGFEDSEITQMQAAIRAHNNKDDVDILGHLLRTSDKLSRNCFCCNASNSCDWSAEKKTKTIQV